MRLVELTLEDFDSGITAISLVDNPAIQSDFLALSESKLLLKVEDEAKRTVTGAILIPDLHILRLDADENPYHIYFSKDTVEQLSQKYLKDFNQEKVTLQHQFGVDGVTMTESWIKVSDVNDKSVALGLDVPIGTWLGSFKVDNDEVWNDWISSGHLKGFSIEAQKLTSNIINMTAKEIATELKEIFSPTKEVETPKEVEIKLATEEQHLELCGKVETLTEALQKLIDAQAEEVIEVAPEEEVAIVEEPKVEMAEVKEEKETVEMIAHTDTAEEVSKPLPKFDYKLTPSQRIELAMKQ